MYIFTEKYDEDDFQFCESVLDRGGLKKAFDQQNKYENYVFH